MRIHFIAIGGAAMHNLAIALKKSGHLVSGSDDEIFEPSRSHLKENGLLPAKMGWDPENIHNGLDLIILGMHARSDNAELIKAREIGLPINSYPEFIYNQSIHKKRVVIAGSHGKTSTTSMILHVLKALNLDFDFMVGAQIRGFDTMVKLSDAPLIVLEGDEYLSSPVDQRAKFLWYKPHIAVITGISWDHINVYPTKESYNKAFADFIKSIESDGCYFYFDGDDTLRDVIQSVNRDILREGYSGFDFRVENGITVAMISGKKYPLKIFGRHNIQNMQAARLVCHSLGVSDARFFEAITTFEGAANRLESLNTGNGKRVFKDFAHSPSKLKATVKACKEQYPGEKLLAVMELHTFSSLNKKFLDEYANSLNDADLAMVYFDPNVISHKKLEEISISDVKNAFRNKELIVLTTSDEVRSKVTEYSKNYQTILLMSSGNFGGIKLDEFAKSLVV